MVDFAAYRQSVEALDVLLSQVLEGWAGSDAALGMYVREHVSQLHPAVIVLRCFAPPLDFPPEMRPTDFGRLVTTIHAARRTALFNHHRWFEQSGGWPELLVSMKGLSDNRHNRPMVDALIGHAVINFMRLLKEERAAENRTLLDHAVEAAVPDYTVGGAHA